jgi:hypothetical protein
MTEKATAAVLSAVRDSMAVAGGALVTYGFGLAWRPLGFIVGGALLAGVGVVGALRERRREDE